MRNLIFLGGLVGLSLFPGGAIQAQDFNRDIRPLLSDRCFKCHGPDEAANDSGVRLDLAEDAYDSGAVVPGDIDASSLIERILTDDDDLKMPPPGSHLTITDQELELLKRWISNGAEYDQHWAFKSVPGSVATPGDLENPDWVRNDIDAFVLRRLEANRLPPSAEAEKWRWLRRVTYDLTGLPPTPEELANFQADNETGAYEKVVDRLLASENYGKHMAVSWLDVARYADSYGYQSDRLSPTWPYRDWVVRALNDNLPYDDFLAWQIAGDMLPEASSDQLLATAFNRLHRMTNEGGSVELEWRTEYVADRVNTFGTAMLGLTLECARCHDHKFDPITQKDYYSLSAFFNNIDEWGMYNDSARVPTPTILLPTPAQNKRLAELEVLVNQNRLLNQQSRSMVKGNFQAEYFRRNPEIQIDVQPIARWTLDELDGNQQFANDVAGEAPGRTSSANQLVAGFRGKALRLTGDDAAEFPVADNWLEPWQPYSISMWLRIPDGLDDAVILHRQGGTDVGTFGTSLRLIDGHLRFAKVRFWPGNALAVRTTSVLPKEQWVHVVITNDGSGMADGMNAYIDGRKDSAVLRDHLTKDPQHRPGKNSGFVVGEQFRRVGFKGGIVDEISVFDVALSPVEVVATRDQKSSFNSSDFSVTDLEEHLAAIRSATRNQVNPVKELLQARVGVVETMVMQEMPGESHAYVLNRGEYDASRTEGNVAPRATPDALPAMPSDLENTDRLSLANWLTSDSHPLASRIAVNRFWQNFFGSGLIDTPDDLGYQSRMPVYADLLDWLARDFMDHDWDVRRLCKQIVLSATYRQSSRCTESLRQRDPDNRLLARGPANRLTAEMIRDTVLFTSGLLDNKAGGPPVSPYQPPNIWRENNTMTPAYRESVGADLYRRSLYTVWKRTTPMPNMMAFDATSREVCVVQRSRTNTPQQAMVLLNDVQFVEAARVLAEKVIDEYGEATETKKLQVLFTSLAGRSADQREIEVLLKLLADQRERFAKDSENAMTLANSGQAPVSEKADVVEVAALTVVTQAIINCDAVIWKR